MVEAPAPACSVVVPRRSPARFRLPRHGLRRKVHVVRLGNGAGGAGTRAGGVRGLCGLRRRIKLRWFRSAMWRLAELCVAALSGPPGRAEAPSSSSWAGVEPCFAAPFVPAAVLGRRTGQD